MLVRHWLAAAALCVMVVPAAGPAMAGKVVLEVDAGDSGRVETPVCAEVACDVPAGEAVVEIEGPGGKLPAQLLPAAEKGKASLCWIVSLQKGRKATYTATISKGKPAGKGFAFQDEKGKHLDLLFDGRKVTRLMYAFDPDPKKRFPTAKPFTHVFDAAGQKIITSPGAQPYPHHRGIFIGWSRTKVAGGKSYGFWGMGRTWQRVEKFTARQAGPVLGRMAASILWEAKQDTPVLTEERTITVFRRAKAELLLEFLTTLRTPGPDVSLGGDPEHAGCQFRAHPEVAKNQQHTRYLLRAGMKEGRRGTLDMPWACMSFKLGESRFNVAHLNHPDNPKGTVYSANRRYGRFGAFPTATVKADKPLTLRYRIFVREGAEPLTVDEIDRLHADFTTPPKVTVKP